MWNFLIEIHINFDGLASLPITEDSTVLYAGMCYRTLLAAITSTTFGCLHVVPLPVMVLTTMTPVEEQL